MLYIRMCILHRTYQVVEDKRKSEGKLQLQLKKRSLTDLFKFLGASGTVHALNMYVVTYCVYTLCTMYVFLSFLYVQDVASLHTKLLHGQCFFTCVHMLTFVSCYCTLSMCRLSSIVHELRTISYTTTL